MAFIYTCQPRKMIQNGVLIVGLISVKISKCFLELTLTHTLASILYHLELVPAHSWPLQSEVPCGLSPNFIHLSNHLPTDPLIQSASHPTIHLSILVFFCLSTHPFTIPSIYPSNI